MPMFKRASGSRSTMGQIPHERIVSDPDIMMGKPIIKGTRIT
jgi:uncharacterized protein (DUF433 family)